MPLSPPAARQPQHRRVIDMHGYAREDGLFDIEGHLIDSKPEGFSTLDREVGPDEPLHGMWLRLTVDVDLLIHACEAATDFSPYAICPRAAPNFARLAGLRIGPGFNRAVQERVGGTIGCTHLREMLAQLATVAFQTTYEARQRRRGAEKDSARRPAAIDTCLAYAEDSDVVARHWPAYVAGRRSAAE